MKGATTPHTDIYSKCTLKNYSLFLIKLLVKLIIGKHQKKKQSSRI